MMAKTNGGNVDTLSPLQTLYDVSHGKSVPMPAVLADLYGRLELPAPSGRPYVMGNFVATLDGVVSLNIAGKSGGGEISGFNDHDRMVMGILRAVSDAVIVGAGTLRAVPHHLWDPEHTYKPLSEVYQTLRKNLGKAGPPLTVILTESGKLDVSLPVFTSGKVPVLVMTNRDGLQEIKNRPLPPHVLVEAVAGSQPAKVQAILDAVSRVHHCDVILTEGGPHVLGEFLAADLLDELFLTLAPQIAGRADISERPALVEGKVFAPEHSLWGKLVSIKRGGEHLFLRYSFK
jgi:riboflavin biosynthesis pyrimidine reductase